MWSIWLLTHSAFVFIITRDDGGGLNFFYKPSDLVIDFNEYSYRSCIQAPLLFYQDRRNELSCRNYRGIKQLVNIAYLHNKQR